jgi:transporter family protein
MSWLHWALLSAGFAGLTAVLSKVGVEKVDSNLATAIRTTVVLVLAWAVALWRSPQPLSAVPQKAWVFLVLSGFATAASWLCYFRALYLGKASLVAPIDKLSVVVAIFLAVLFLHEKLAWQDWLGVALIVSGAVVIALPRE